MSHAHATCPSISGELALGMDAALEATERDLEQVRAILHASIEGLLVEFGARALHEGVVALQFQDLSEQLLASAARRLEMVRTALDKHVTRPPSRIPAALPLAPGAAEFFQEIP